jgi:hypothetical protein
MRASPGWRTRLGTALSGEGMPASCYAIEKREKVGGRDKDRTCDPYDVNVVLYR